MRVVRITDDAIEIEDAFLRDLQYSKGSTIRTLRISSVRGMAGPRPARRAGLPARCLGGACAPGAAPPPAAAACLHRAKLAGTLLLRPKPAVAAYCI
jgi:hypothetical protein